MAKKKQTAAARARARRDPTIFRPPKRVHGSNRSAIATLRLTVGGRVYPIGPNIEQGTPWSLGMDQAGEVTLPVRDPDEKMVSIFDDEALLQSGGARVTIDGIVYVVNSVDADGEGLYTLQLIDEVAWRLQGFTSFKVASRKTTTRFGFIYSFVREASAKPYPKMRAFVPEVDDIQPIAIAKPEAT